MEECALTAVTIQLEDIVRRVQNYSILDLIVTRLTPTFVQVSGYTRYLDLCIWVGSFPAANSVAYLLCVC